MSQWKSKTYFLSTFSLEQRKEQPESLSNSLMFFKMQFIVLPLGC